jgi:2'-5' RNA ligase
MLVLNMPEELKLRILKVKEEFAEKYKLEHAPVRPQLMLASFTQYAMIEERILNRLRTVGMGLTPFKIELKDFGSFPTHTIYINVSTKLPLQNLVKSVRTESQRLMKYDEERKPHFILEPFLAIGMKLKPWQYEKAWLEYSHKHFTGRFIAEGMSLLRRPLSGDGSPREKYQVVERFELQNMPVFTKQGELFG